MESLLTLVADLGGISCVVGPAGAHRPVVGHPALSIRAAGGGGTGILALFIDAREMESAIVVLGTLWLGR